MHPASRPSSYAAVHCCYICVTTFVLYLCRDKSLHFIWWYNAVGSQLGIWSSYKGSGDESGIAGLLIIKGKKTQIYIYLFIFTFTFSDLIELLITHKHAVSEETRCTWLETTGTMKPVTRTQRFSAILHTQLDNLGLGGVLFNSKKP